jgi:predicted unusual protein kinase regulating ubiquinone biosynthesis (AarF/ABC1/UbiB family)
LIFFTELAMAFDTTQDLAHRNGGSIDIIDAEAITLTGEVLAADVVTPPRTLDTKAQDPFEEFGYDPDAIAAHYRRRPFKVWARFVGIFLPMITFFAQLWLDRRGGRSAQNEAKRAIQLRKMLTKLGPAYIKIGQALSTRPDLVPPIFLEELTTLQDQIPPFANAIAYRFIEEELGAPPSQIYAEISPPCRAASLGQVYKGKLHSGEDVAIKVQRPGLAQRIALDLYIIRGVGPVCHQSHQPDSQRLVAIMDEFGERIFEEMDYTHEGQNAQRFADLYGHIADIYVPHIYPASTPLAGYSPWSGLKALNSPTSMRWPRKGIDATHLIDVGVQCSLRQLLSTASFTPTPTPATCWPWPMVVWPTSTSA